MSKRAAHVEVGGVGGGVGGGLGHVCANRQEAYVDAGGVGGLSAVGGGHYRGSAGGGDGAAFLQHVQGPQHRVVLHGGGHHVVPGAAQAGQGQVQGAGAAAAAEDQHALAAHPEIARLLASLFIARFDPAFEGDATAEAEDIASDESFDMSRPGSF